MEITGIVCFLLYFLLRRTILSSANQEVLNGLRFGDDTVPCQLGNHMTSEQRSEAVVTEIEGGIRITWPGVAYVIITESDVPTTYDVSCQNISWVAENCEQHMFEDCFSLDEAHWYGGGTIEKLLWPIEKWDRAMKPFVPGDAIGSVGVYNSEYAGVLERYWLNSKGRAIYAGSEVPLWVSVNETGDGQFCLRSTYVESPYNNHDDSNLFLSYTLCQAAHVREMQLYAIEHWLDRPIDIPDETLFRYPIYSTWARYHANVSQEKVIGYAEEIVLHGYPSAQLEIDDDWEPSYGQLDFDREKFPDPEGMVAELDSLGFRVTVWVHPFTDVVSETDWLAGLTDPGGLLPALTSWWNGVATIVDFTDERAVDAWNGRLAALRQNYGIASFKFDAGEASYLPAAYRPAVPFRNPADYATRYAELAHLADAEVRHQEVRVGYRTQRLPIYVRMLDKYSSWHHDNGLRTVIPHALQFAIIGYPFVLPDMVGGNAYAEGYPDRELFVRWTELNVFLPGFQFSIVPWQYDDEVVAICRRMLELHAEYADLMIELARNATQTGQPIVRPLWWVAPQDDVALEIDSEFLVGDDLLVAPVVEEGARSRDVYLPEGRWMDMNNQGVVMEGGRWHYNYSAPLDVLPYFSRLL